ncbi:TIGR00725 family protein [Burkholderia sp. Leaf177]|uniref:TIGR00725 family protein n=1 Tax=Burkholderia sp. Leaf177 TaxID=1736287 RepID=UPI001F289515|nr:TIGR00725 family protein [Burkholderia sp. Leaf177]
MLAGIQSGTRRCPLPVAIIGPGDGGSRECTAAYDVATILASGGVPIICGGRGGVMEAASRGASDSRGIVVGILPEEDLSGANRYLTIAIPTGIGEMRNALIARSGICLVAIGGGMGTLSEIALGLKWGKPVFTLYEDAPLPGTRAAKNVSQLLDWVLECLVSKLDVID